jgi:carbamoyl-phosphate synthase/aspartate carbamoyltransferase/dihydroorotase
MIRLPGLTDPHVHLRVPGGEQKEDISSGTAAAVAGGFTSVLAMPNTQPPLITPERIREVKTLAQTQAWCDIHFFGGASPDSIDRLPDLAQEAVGLKVYMDQTYGPLRIEGLEPLISIFKKWPQGRMISFHSESNSMAVGVALAAIFFRPVHICHVSRKAEIELIAEAKKRGLPVTCEVTPHHLFLSKDDLPRLGPLGDMRPTLADKTDVEALWEHIDTTIDCIATDHAPHTLAEKAGPKPPPGVPGLETALPLMLTAVHEKRLSLERLVELMAVNPRKIYHLPAQEETWIEVDPDARHEITDEGLFTKCGWTPFAGFQAQGRVTRVVIRGKTVFEDGKLISRPERIRTQ